MQLHRYCINSAKEHVIVAVVHDFVGLEDLVSAQVYVANCILHLLVLHDARSFEFNRICYLQFAAIQSHPKGIALCFYAYVYTNISVFTLVFYTLCQLKIYALHYYFNVLFCLSCTALEDIKKYK